MTGSSVSGGSVCGGRSRRPPLPALGAVAGEEPVEVLELRHPGPVGPPELGERPLQEDHPPPVHELLQEPEADLEAVFGVVEPPVGDPVPETEGAREVGEAPPGVAPPDQARELEGVEEPVGRRTAVPGPGPQRPLEAGVVGEDRVLAQEVLELGPDLGDRRGPLQGLVGDPGQAPDGRRDGGPGIDEPVERALDAAVDRLDRADLDDPIASDVESRGLEVECDVAPREQGRSIGQDAT